MKIFKNIFFPFSKHKKFSLASCCEYLNLYSPQDNFHSAIYDAFMTARLLCKIYDALELINSLNSAFSQIEKEYDVNNNKINEIEDNLYNNLEIIKNDTNSQLSAKTRDTNYNINYTDVIQPMELEHNDLVRIAELF